MRPLPRLLAVTADHVVAREDFSVRVAAALSVGPGLGVLVSAPHSSPSEVRRLVERVVALAATTEAGVLIRDEASLLEVPGVQGGVFLPSAWPAVPPTTRWIGADVGPGQAPPPNAAFLVLRPAGRDGATTAIAAWQQPLLADGRPVFLSGLALPEGLHAARDAGAYGVACTEAVYDAGDPGRAAAELLAGWHRA